MTAGYGQKIDMTWGTVPQLSQKVVQGVWARLYLAKIVSRGPCMPKEARPCRGLPEAPGGSARPELVRRPRGLGRDGKRCERGDFGLSFWKRV
jgi:hypothetical protein